MFQNKCFSHNCSLLLSRYSALLKKPWVSRSTLRAFLIVGMLLAVLAWYSMETYYPKEGADMRNEIIAYLKSVESRTIKPVILDDFGALDVTHIVEKYIKMGDSIETAKDILLKNGFSVGDARNGKNTGYRIHATCKIKEGLYYHKFVRVFVGKGPESQNVDSVEARIYTKSL